MLLQQNLIRILFHWFFSADQHLPALLGHSSKAVSAKTLVEQMEILIHALTCKPGLFVNITFMHRYQPHFQALTACAIVDHYRKKKKKKKKVGRPSHLGTMLGCHHKHLLFCMHGGSSILITDSL